MKLLTAEKVRQECVVILGGDQSTDRDLRNVHVQAICDQAALAHDLLDELHRALPFLEDMRLDPCYKQDAVKDRIEAIKAAIKLAEGQ